jgi:hypothetical protein
MRSSRFTLSPAARARAALVAIACASLTLGAHLALAQPKPAGSTKAGSSRGAPSAAPSASAASTAIVPDTIEGSEELQKLYMEGEDALHRMAFTEAETLFTKAWGLSKSFDVAGRLGEAKLDMGKYREAAQYISYALRNAAPSTRASRREALKKDLEDARKKLATVKLTASVVEAKIAIDGVVVDPIFLGPELFVEPGKHTFEASADGYDTAKQVVDTKVGEIFVVSLTLERPSARPLPTSAPTSAPSSGTPWPAAALAGAGGLGVVLGAVFVGVAEARKGDAYAAAKDTFTADGKPTCPKQGPGPTPACDKIRGATSDVDLFGNMGVGAFIAGGVLVAGAVGYMFLLAPPKDGAKTSQLVPVVSPQGGGFVWRGSF